MASAALVAARAHRKDEDPFHAGDKALAHAKFPPRKEFLEDVIVCRRLISALGTQWPERRKVLTADRVYFSKTSDENSVIDSIPVLEIEKVQPLRNRAATSRALSHVSSGRSPARSPGTQDSWAAQMHNKWDLGTSSPSFDVNGSIDVEDRNPEHIFVIYTTNSERV